MKILVLCKRRYTRQDVIADRYGRLFWLPEELALLGHSVSAVALPYKLGVSRVQCSESSAGVRWTSWDATPGPAAYVNRVANIAREERVDVIWASSDVLHAIFANKIARRVGVPYIVDAYDDYEAFGLSRVPGLRRQWRRACEGASALTVVTETLRQQISRRLVLPVPMHVVGNGVDRKLFRPLPKQEARQRLGLSQDLLLIGTAGALDASRGIGDLYGAFKRISEQRSDARLLLAGHRDGTRLSVSADKVIDLGRLPHAHMPVFFSALDVGVICNRDTAFGRSCYPMKLAEMLACGTPLVAASVGDTRAILRASPSSMFAPGDVSQLYDRIVDKIASARDSEPATVHSWKELAQKLEADICRSLAASGHVTCPQG